MTPFVFLAIASSLLGVAIGIFSLVVIGIRRGDGASHLADRPRTRTDALARRFLAGVRTDNGDKTEGS